MEQRLHGSLIARLREVASAMLQASFPVAHYLDKDLDDDSRSDCKFYMDAFGSLFRGVYVMRLVCENKCGKWVLLSVLVLPLISLLLFASSDANAGMCVVGQVKEVGTWINPDVNTSGITKAVFGEECRDDRRTVCSGGICRTTFGVKLVYTAKLWGKCHPTDCYWGKVDGVYTSANWLRFGYDHGFAKRTVWGQIWSGGNSWLRLIVDTDFVSPSREDYRFSVWMKRQ
jgi:hypothetical protein